MAGDAVLHGRAVRAWAAGPRAATWYRRGWHPGRRTSPPASLLRWSWLAARRPAGVSAVSGSAHSATTTGA